MIPLTVSIVTCDKDTFLLNKVKNVMSEEIGLLLMKPHAATPLTRSGWRESQRGFGPHAATLLALSQYLLENPCKSRGVTNVAALFCVTRYSTVTVTQKFPQVPHR